MMLDQKFFDQVRATVFDGGLDQSQVDGLNAIALAIPNSWSINWSAYAFATATLETNHTMQPVREAYWMSEGWRKSHLRYWPYYGRGYVQVTWRENYEKFERIVGKNLVLQPDLALDPTISAKIMIYGMENGLFTGKKLSDYLTGNRIDFYNARQIINGLDKAEMISSMAWEYSEALGNLPNVPLAA